jgi:alpha-L-fucosidase
LYVFILGPENWDRGTRREFVIHSVQSTEKTKINVLGQGDDIVEYMTVDPTSRLEQTEDGLKISIVRAQRIYNNHKWPNPVVVKLTDIKPALRPPAVKTISDPVISGSVVVFGGEVLELGDADKVDITFLYRKAPRSLNERLRDEGWKRTDVIEAPQPGIYQVEVMDLETGIYEFRAMVVHPKINIMGEIYRFELR